MDHVEVGDWIQSNILDSDAWDRSAKQAIAVVQAVRNLARWYPDVTLTVDVISYQSIWELQGTDPALKYQKHNVKQVSDNGESVSYKDGERPVVSPDVRDLLGATTDELAEVEAEEAAQCQYGGELR